MTRAPAEAARPQSVPRWWFVVPALLVFGGSLALDVRGLMPGLGFWDTAEFQTLGPVLGIAHPTGYPSYTLLLWLASVVLQPFGDPALRANLLSAVLISGAAALTTIAIVQLTRRPAIGLAAGLLLAVAPIPWRNALRADPHPLHLFLAALLLVLLFAWASRERAGDARAGRLLVAAAIVFGLALGNHALTLLLAPGVAAWALLSSPAILWRRWRLVLACGVALVVTTVLIYGYIPLRSAMDPPLNYAHPTTWEHFRYLVLGEQFQGTFHAMPSLDEGLRTVWEQLRTNLGPGALLAVVGLAVGWLRNPRALVLTGLWFTLTWSFALGYENADIERYYLVPILVGVIWAALAVDAAWWAVCWIGARAFPGALDGRFRAALTLGVAALLVIGIVQPVPERAAELDSSSDTSAREWLDAALAALPADALIVSWWSYSTPLWYGRWVEGRRPDITIMDDRTILDEGLGDVGGVIDRYLGERPVLVIRLDRDLTALRRDYHLELLPGSPGYGQIWRVVPPDGSP